MSRTPRSPRRTRRRPALRPRPEPLEARTAPAVFLVTSTDDSGPGTLRQAILDADAAGGTGTVAFQIPGAGVRTIAPRSPLPALSATMTVDGTTQPGYSGSPLIEIDGSNAGTNPDGSAADGLAVTASSVTVEGLTIDGFTGHGVSIRGGNHNTVRACYIGTDPTGERARPNGGDGVFLTNASDNTVGGPGAADRNVISGNKGNGIHVLFGGTSDRNVFQNNLIGTDATGTVPLGNGADGVNLFADSTFDRILDNVISGNTGSGVSFFSPGPSDALIQGNKIGTDEDGIGPVGNGGKGVDIGGPPRTRVIGNVISANRLAGVNLTFDTTVGTVVQGNLIGVAADGLHALGNLDRGVSVNFNASGALIGGTDPGEGNTIAYNGFTFNNGGVEADSGSIGIAVEGNSIYSNYGLGIDLNGDGVTPNAPGSPRTGANNLVGYPLLTAAGSSPTVTGLAGTLVGDPNTAYRVEFFGSPAADPTGYGEGRVFLGATPVTTDATGSAAFNAVLPTPVPPGWVVSATATDSRGNTSEFSPALTVGSQVAGLSVQLSESANPVVVGATVVFTLTVTNVGTDPVSGVVLRDGLPSGVLYESVSVTQGTVTISGGTVTATVGTLAGGATATLTVSAVGKTPGTSDDTAGVVSELGTSTPAAVSTRVVLNSATVEVTPGVANPVYGQTLTFTAVVTPVEAGATAPSGTVRFAIDGSPTGRAVALVNGVATSPAVPGLAAGGHTVTVWYSGDAAFAPSGPATVGFSVAKAHLTLAAQDQSRLLGQKNPPLTYTITGFVNGESASVLTGQPSLTTTATDSSPPGAYPITVGPGSLSASNYDFPAPRAATLTVRPTPPLDFDGSGRSEIAVVATARSQWYAVGNGGGYLVGTFGATNLADIPAPGDYDGVGRTEMAVFRPSTAQWFVMGPTGSRLLGTFGARNLTDLPVPGDYDRTGHAEMAVFRPSTGQWFVMGPTGARLLATFGSTGLVDIPVPADYDGVGHAEPAVFRPSTGQWFVLGPGGGRLLGTFGARNLTDVPVPGDYDGTGHAEMAVFRPSTGQWFVMRPGGGTLLGNTGIAMPGDVPAGGPIGMMIRAGRLPGLSALKAASAAGPKAMAAPPVEVVVWDVAPDALRKPKGSEAR